MKKTVLFSLLFALTCSANDFPFKLYEQLSQTKGNLFFSPASIEAALAMTQEGAAGETRQQFDTLLPQAPPSVPALGHEITLESANAIWVDQQLPILGRFQHAVTEKHQADIRPADFQGQPDAERQTINRWVEVKTRDKIKNLLPDGSVNAMTRMILVNAIYFKGDWLHAFDPKQTEEAVFQTVENGPVEVPMMHLNETQFRYGENDCFQTLELPYEGEDVSMLLILPRPEVGLAHIEQCFAPGNLEACTKEMGRCDVNVVLPRFKVESTFASLKRNLAALGLTDAFNARDADFSGISEQPLFIDDVIHKAFVEVNEEGTEAAAATGLIMRTTSIGPPPVTFRADRPFIFLLRENKTGNILFMGRICDPSK